MNGLYLVCLVVSISCIEIVLSENYRPIHQIESWRNNHPGLLKYFPLIDDSEFAGRIVGGNEVTAHSVPFQTGLLISVPGGTALCGGSLLSPTIVLTAAHCVDGGFNVEVVIGAHNINSRTEPGQVRLTTRNITVHPQWNPNIARNDIAVLRLPSPVTYTNNIRPVTLPPRNQLSNNFAGTTGTVTGWGRTSDQSPATSAVLRTVSNPILTNEVCRQAFDFVQPSNICLSGQQARSACNGDSGGPLVVSHAGGVMQVGIVSFGSISGCQTNEPSAYSRITSFSTWIETVTGIPIVS